MLPTDAVAVLQGALVVVAGLAVILWRVPGPCGCEKCAFHVNERRMEVARQAELDHNFSHKGMGFRDTSPDKYDCDLEGCPRNKGRGTL